MIRAIEECSPRSLRQRCLAHKMRNLQSKVQVPGDVAHYSGMMSPSRYDLISPSVPR
jgi:transposase-like protein